MAHTDAPSGPLQAGEHRHEARVLGGHGHRHCGGHFPGRDSWRSGNRPHAHPAPLTVGEGGLPARRHRAEDDRRSASVPERPAGQEPQPAARPDRCPQGLPEAEDSQSSPSGAGLRGGPPSKPSDQGDHRHDAARHRHIVGPDRHGQRPERQLRLLFLREAFDLPVPAGRRRLRHVHIAQGLLRARGRPAPLRGPRARQGGQPGPHSGRARLDDCRLPAASRRHAAGLSDPGRLLLPLVPRSLESERDLSVHEVHAQSRVLRLVGHVRRPAARAVAGVRTRRGRHSSWWGQGSRTDTRIPTLLSATRSLGSDFRWSLYYEHESIADPSAAEIAGRPRATSATSTEAIPPTSV